MMNISNLPIVLDLAKKATPDNLAATLQQMSEIGVPPAKVYEFAEALMQDQRDSYEERIHKLRSAIERAVGKAVQ